MKKIHLLPSMVMLLSLGIFSCKKSSTPVTPQVVTAFTLTSPAVVNGLLLNAYKCEPKVSGVEKSIPMAWANPPANTNAYAITMIHYPNANDSSIISSYMELWGIDKSVTGIGYGLANNGPWYMGPNKDLNVISYTSPCSAGTGTHRYTITIYALSATPASLPKQNSMSVTYSVLKNSLSTVTILGKTSLVFDSVTP